MAVPILLLICSVLVCRPMSDFPPAVPVVHSAVLFNFSILYRLFDSFIFRRLLY